MAEEKELHWTQEKEQVSSSRPIRLLILLVSSVPLWLVHLLVFPVAFFYLLCSSRARRETKLYQKRLISYSGRKSMRIPHPYLQIVSFSLCVLEKIEGWSGKIMLDKVIFKDDDVVDLKKNLSEGKGALLIGSHLGNLEMFRSLASFNRTGVDRNIPVIAIMDTEATVKFNDTISEVNPGVAMNIISPSDIGVDTMSRLIDHVQKGGLVVIAADRTSAASLGRSIPCEFLGQTALFPYGPFLIAALLNAPTYFVFSMRTKTATLSPKYTMYVKKSAYSFACPRTEREDRIHLLCRQYVGLLEKYCIEYPFQWYNFYNFWAIPGKAEEAALQNHE